MSSTRTRKIIITGVLGAISVLLSFTPLGLITWFAGISMTTLHVPVIIGAILEGPWVGAGVGLIFGISSMLQAAIMPRNPSDAWFTNPLLSVLPRLFIGPVTWLVYRALERRRVPAIIAAGIAGSLTNTVLVLGVIGLQKLVPWEVIGTIGVTNGLPEAALAAVLTLAVVAAWQRIEVGKKKGADL
ncbi:MAG TPA: ECF transporter S component [Anaerolineae bacterium]|nr:ECF transporter S component [Anaerolineae bacterium]